MEALLNHRHRYSFTAGICAAGGSFFGKLPSFLAAQKVLMLHPPLPSRTTLLQPEVAIYLEFALLQALPFVLMVACNVLNWRYFLKALQASQQQTLTATVLCAASNYVGSFILAAVIYQEPISRLSVLGSALIVAGLWFLCGNEDIQTAPKVKQKSS